MGFEVALGSSDSRVRSCAVRREVSRGTSGAPAYLVINPLGPPRLWRWVGDEVAQAFERAVQPADGNPGGLRPAVDAAGAAIARVRAQLIEPELTVDAQLGALFTGGDALHAALTAGIRLYRARAGVPERLFAKVPRSFGVAAGGLHMATERAAPGDLFVLGTRETFTVRSIGNLAAALSRSPNTPVSELCEAVVGPCRDAGIGGAAVVLRAL